MLNHVPFAIPVKRLRETDSLVVFFHPKPAYPFHVILLPKKGIHSFSDLEPDSPFLIFPRLHFHLISGPAIVQRPTFDD
jgi:hypothetical protein